MRIISDCRRKDTEMKNAYMVEFELPEEFTEEFMALIPRQRFMINQMLADGIIQNYSLSLDRSRLWAVMIAESEFSLMEEIERMPLIDYMVPDISQLMFHNSSMELRAKVVYYNIESIKRWEPFAS